MPTDRKYLKYQQAGALATTGASSPVAEIQSAHRRQRTVSMPSSANAATNVAETVCFTVNRKSKLSFAKLVVPTTNIAGHNTDYFHFKVYKRTSAGASQTLIAQYNTHTSAQSSVTLQVPASFSVVDNSDSEVNANSLITYEVLKYGSGKAIDQYSVVDFDFEEI